ncbi:hypothetical protein CC80DRAFT_487649 [Byssothecium circinans]|uniref:Cora-domain-containing protein n=1 Tax=Byssothecium circinans TaxID=147558 RepID=A0A6A5UEF0_9PLEO|nr:hypothetical protein CC80DRAFT_487649 [Byssothecium circinans]
MNLNRVDGGILNRLWEEKYSRQQSAAVYLGEDRREDPLLFPGGISLFQHLQNGDKRRLIETFLRFVKDRLDPPGELHLSALREWLSTAVIENLQQHQVYNGPGSSTIVLDERRDPTDTTSATRHWDSETYLRYPPIGLDVNTEKLDLPRLASRLSRKRLEHGVERRTLHVCDVTSSCAMIIIATAPTRLIPILRTFFYNYLRFRPLIRISMATIYNLEFHIPYLALRQAPKKIDSRGLRKAYKLPLPRPKDKEAYFYEAQTSFVLTGVDERLYTAICLADTFFGSEEQRGSYTDPTSPLDAPSGGGHWLNNPIWNPRQYLLKVLAKRISQTRGEWMDLIDQFVARLDHYESGFELPDDPKLTKTTALTSAEITIRLFRDRLASTIRAWEDFYSHKGGLFEVESIKLYSWWQTDVTAITESISDLKEKHELMAEKLEQFRSMRDGLVNASSFRESAEATRQGNMIGILTRMTVLFLPLGWVTAFFGIPLLPHTLYLWIAYCGVLVVAILGTLYFARRPKLLESLFESGM